MTPRDAFSEFFRWFPARRARRDKIARVLSCGRESGLIMFRRLAAPARLRCVLALFLGSAALFGPASGISPAKAGESDHAIAMHGEPALPKGFEHLPYADPKAPKGGRIV